MRSILGLVVAAALFAASPTFGRDNFRSGSWGGAAYPEDGGPFSHCAMIASYKSGISMLFSIDRAYNFKIGFVSAAWSLRKGDAYDVTYFIDGSRPYVAKATAISESAVTIDIPDTTDLFRRFKSGYVLTVEAVGSRFKFNLDGTYVALNELLSCTARNTETAAGGAASGGSNPFGKAAPALPTQPATSSAEARVSATAFVANLLNRAGLSQYEIMTGAEIPDFLRIYDVVWKGTGVFGMLRIVGPGQYQSVDQLAAAVIAKDSSECKGAFATGSQTIPASQGLTLRQLFTACEGDNKLYLVRTLVPLRSGGFYEIVHAASGERRQIDSANSQIVKILPAVMTSR